MYDVDRVMRALRGAGVRKVIWVTLRATTLELRRLEREDPDRGAALGRASSSPTGTRTAAASPGSGRTACTSRRREPSVSHVCCGRSSSQAPPPRSCPQRMSITDGSSRWERHVSGLTTSRGLSTGRPQAGITSERMFCSPCTGAGLASLGARMDVAGEDGLTPRRDHRSSPARGSGERVSRTCLLLPGRGSALPSFTVTGR